MAQGKLPDLWKLSNIKPIPKCKPANIPKDYRPVALTFVIVKCLERLLVKYFQPLVKDLNRFAYRQHWSTEDAVMLTLDSLTGHLILIDKLPATKMNPNIIKWAYSFLSNRKQMVTSSNKTSSKLKTSTGSPQGCVLSPIPFSIYTDELQSSSENQLVIKYADDTLILELLTQHQQSELQSRQSTLDTTSEWCTNNKLLINESKKRALTCSFSCS